MTEPEQNLMSKTAVMEIYGLPDSWIKRIGAPDKVGRNPYWVT